MIVVLDRAPADQLLLLVKALRNLSMFDGALDALERSGAIARLVPLLAARAAAPEVQNQVHVSRSDGSMIAPTERFIFPMPLFVN